MKNLPFFLALFAVSQLAAQSFRNSPKRYLEAGVFVGAANYSGDLAEQSIVFPETKLAFGAHARQYLSQQVAVRANFLIGSISGNDANAGDDELKKRSFEFKTNFFEASVVGEWHPLNHERFSDDDIYGFSPLPYLFAGFGATFSRPELEYYGTPEKRDNYVRSALPEGGKQQTLIGIPFGLGVNFNLSDRIAVGIEAGARVLFSDTLDGVENNGNPDKNDWYYFGGATFSYVLKKGKR